MTARKTKLTDDTARAIAHAIGTRPFERHGYDAKYSAQRNLDGKTHYADDDTLKFFHARINSCRTECNGLVLILIESAAKDMHNSARGHRFVAFDLFGTVINHRDHVDAMHSKSDGARVAMRNLRRDANATLKDLLKNKACSEDEERRAQDDIQKLTDKYVAEVDKQFAQKEVELMAI